MATTSKQISLAYYGQEHKRAYLYGCSTGGRQVYQSAQQFPEDYDGLLPTAPFFQGSLYYPSIGYSTIVVKNYLKDEPFGTEQLEIVSQKAVAAM